jgi:TetR/AcrR family transcriptional regulator, regulator of autoinduction and epiphytic fitness
MNTQVRRQRSSRSDRARATRLRIVEAATRLFTTDGYTATTMEQVADEAGVAVQTVYYTFGTKGRLLCEAMEFAAAGAHDPIPVSQRPWVVEAMSTASAPRAVALSVEHGVDIYERVAPLWPAVNAAAAAEAAVEKYWGDVTAGRRAGMRRLIARIGELDGLRQDLDIDTATDVMFVLNGHGTFHGLVIEASWSLNTFKAWLYTTLVQQLLAPQTRNPLAGDDLGFDWAIEG